MILSFGIPRMPYTEKIPQDFDCFENFHPPTNHQKSIIIKILRIFLSVGHPRDPKGEDHGYLTTFKGINATKSVPFKYENNAQTLPKQL